MRHLLLAVSTAALLLSAATAFAADRSAVIRSPAATPAAAENYSGTVIVEKTG